MDSRHIVCIKRGWTILRVSKFEKDARRYFACFAAVTAAINSASVLEVAVVD